MPVLFVSELKLMLYFRVVCTLYTYIRIYEETYLVLALINVLFLVIFATMLHGLILLMYFIVMIC
jgi:hypothetical protein